jgi:hypothetical protein
MRAVNLYSQINMLANISSSFNGLFQSSSPSVPQIPTRAPSAGMCATTRVQNIQKEVPRTLPQNLTYLKPSNTITLREDSRFQSFATLDNFPAENTELVLRSGNVVSSAVSFPFDASSKTALIKAFVSARQERAITHTEAAEEPIVSVEPVTNAIEEGHANSTSSTQDTQDASGLPKTSIASDVASRFNKLFDYINTSIDDALDRLLKHLQSYNPGPGRRSSYNARYYSSFNPSEAEDPITSIMKLRAIDRAPAQSAVNLITQTAQHIAGSEEPFSNCMHQIFRNPVRSTVNAAKGALSVASGSAASPVAQLKTIWADPCQAAENVGECFLEAAAFRNLSRNEVAKKIIREWNGFRDASWNLLEWQPLGVWRQRRPCA